jgi:hypothetical protein
MLEPSHLFDTIMAAARKLNPVIAPSTVVAYLVRKIQKMTSCVSVYVPVCLCVCVCVCVCVRERERERERERDLPG